MNEAVKPLGRVQCQLGEGLVWDASQNCLLMTDILEQTLISIDLAGMDCQQWSMQEPLGWVLLTEKTGVYALGLKSGIALFDPAQEEKLTWLDRTFPGDQTHRLNDACADSKGRIWYGSMSAVDGHQKVGRLASFHVSEGVTIHDEGFTVTNGPLIHPDESCLIVNDTLGQCMYRYDFDVSLGQLANRSVFACFSAKEGCPDGMCFDAEGNLWVAMWGVGKVLRLNQNGQIIAQFAVPAPNVTNVCFAGKNRDRLICSTARIEMSPALIGQYPKAGQLFELTGHGTTGLPTQPATTAATTG